MYIKEGDKWKAAFRTNQGSKLLVMFFGLTNCLATFQTMINNIFHNLIVEGIVCVYLNDILIFTKTIEEHYHIICLVLECLHQYQLCFKPKKYKFEQTQMEYLGLIIAHGIAEMDLVKVASIADWLTLQNKEEVQSFLGFINFY